MTKLENKLILLARADFDSDSEYARYYKKMTKLENKLIELGYNIHINNSWSSCAVCFTKYFGSHQLSIHYNMIKEIYHSCYVTPIFRYSKQNQIDSLQLAYNQLQRDLEELEQC